MKKIIIFFSLLVSVQVSAQTYPITSITISLPANPDANTANWGSGTSLFTITANSKAVNGRVDGRVTESKILVTIKKGGAKACGSFTTNTAPASNFNTLTKVWSGTNAVSLLGQSCALPAGEYELTVQFFGTGAAGLSPLSEEKIKPFSIIAKEQLSYQPPQAIAPANGTVLSEIDIKKPITFRWTPVIPRPQEPITYRLKVWQLMQGQNGAQAMATNQPIITKDVDNLTQTMISNLISGPCLAPYLCDYIWNVQALNREGKPVGGNNGMSEALNFNVQTVNDAPTKIALVFPANGSTISAKDKPKFIWKHEKQNSESSNTYKIKIVEIIGDQSPEEALRTNKPHFEKDSLKEISFQYPSSAPSFIAEKKYGWNVQALNREGKTIGANDGNSSPNTFSVNNNKLKTTPATDTGDSLITVKSNPPPAVVDTGSAAIGDTIRAGFDGEFLIAVTQVTKESDGSITGKGTVTVNWLSTNIAVEFSEIRIDTSKRLTAGGIITEKSAGADYIQAWLIANLTAEAATIPLDKPLNWTNNTVDNLVGWYNNNNFGLPDFKYQSNVTAPPIPANSLKMPYGIKFTDTTDKLMITEIVFKPNVSKINFLAQKKFTRGVSDYNLGFAGKYFEIHPNQINFSNGRVELVEDIDVPNLVSDPKMKFTFKKGAPAAGCYIEWDSTGVKDVGLGLDVKFSRDWLLPVPTASDSVKATITGNGTSLQNILLTGSLPNCEIVGTNGVKMLADSITLDLSDTRNPASMYFPANYTSDTTAQGKLLWQGFYIKTLGLTLPDTWKNGANPTQITAANTIIDDYGVTMKVKAINIITFPIGRVSDMSASLDTLNLSILKGSLTDGNAKGKLVLPISRDTITNTLKYTATFAQAGGANNFQIVIVPTGPIDADILKGKMTLSPTSNITATKTPTLLTLSINLNGSFKWDDPVPTVIKGIKMEMDFENLGLVYKSDPAETNNSMTFNCGSWSFASPQKFMANFPVTIKNIRYQSLTTVSTTPRKDLIRGKVLMDIIVNLTDDIGGTVTMGAAFSMGRLTATKKFDPQFINISVDSIEVHASTPAVKVDGKLSIRSEHQIYGNGFLGELTVAFTAVGIKASALVEYGNTNHQSQSGSLYRYWRVEADVVLPAPGVPFLPGIAFRGFGGGAYYNMVAGQQSSTKTPSGKKFTFTPLQGTLGMKVAATIATTPKEETFNADVELLAQFSQSQGLELIAFSGNFYVAANLTPANRLKAKINGNVSVGYNFPIKHFMLSAAVMVNAPPITTPSPATLALDINGKTNLWSFKFGEPTGNDNSLVNIKVNVLGINANLYEYLMFGNNIITPSGFTNKFTTAYTDKVGTPPEFTIEDNPLTAPGKGFAMGIGFAFDKTVNFNLPSNYQAQLALAAGAELNVAFAEYLGNSCVDGTRIGINGWQATGSIGFYASVLASVVGGGSSYNIATIKAGGWLVGRFPNPSYAAGKVEGLIQIAGITTSTHTLGCCTTCGTTNGSCPGYFATHKSCNGHKFAWRACNHPTTNYLVNHTFSNTFEVGTNCAPNASAGGGASVAQGDAAEAQKQLLIQYVYPTLPNPTVQYNYSVTSPIVVRYGLTPNNVFDVSEMQASGVVKTRTFKMVVTTSLKMMNVGTTGFSLVQLRRNVNNTGEHLYTRQVPISTTVTQQSQQMAAVKTNMYDMGNTAVFTYPPPAPTNTYTNLPPPSAPIVNTLTIDRSYQFSVTATLKEWNGSIWIDAKNINNQHVTQTVDKKFRTGPQANSPANTQNTSK